MKKLIQIANAIIISLAVISCTEYEKIDFEVDKPISVENQEEINAYNSLNTYLPESMILGATGLDMSTYSNQGVPFRLINSNFSAITPTSGMNHGDIVSEGGTMSFVAPEDFVSIANASGLSVISSPLVYHRSQSAEYLRELIAPIPQEGGPAWEVITENDFETDDLSNIVSNDGAVVTFTADGEGKDGNGRAMKVENSAVRENDWDSQLFLTWSEATEVGQQYRLTMDIKSDADANFPTQAQIVAFQYKHWNFFGSFNSTSEWQTVEVVITIDENTAGCAALAFNLGFTATNFYFDNVKLEKFNESGGGGPTWDLRTANNFESDDLANIVTNDGAVTSYTADGAGANGSGRALKVENSAVRTNDWESQLFIAWNEPTVAGESYRLVMDIRADVNASFPTQAQLVPFQYKHWNFFGSFNATSEWQHIEVDITIDDNTSECTALAFNLGATATTFYFDNMEIRWLNPDGGAAIELTPEEKKDTLTMEMDHWISGIMGSVGENVDYWEVVRDPISDEDPTILRSGVGIEEQAGDEFYWQDFLDKDYAVTAFKMARQYGDANDMLFISESGLESNLDKCQALVDYVDYIETAGETVDGIITRMHIGLDTDKNDILEMFKLLAASGKMVYVAELNVMLLNEPDADMLNLQAEMYKYVLDTYKAEVPVAQRFGVSVWGPHDQGNWQGLWNTGFTRKPAYASFADGLEGMK